MHATPRAVSSSKHSLEGLVAALRAELQEYGGLLRLLHEEQDLILTDPNRSGAMEGVLDRQLATAREAAGVRTKWMKAVGGEAATDQSIMRRAPVAMRPLLNALFVEVTSVAARVEIFADQNVWLRKRAAQIAELLARRASPAA